MTLYVVSRTRAWVSEEELAATAECAQAVDAMLREHVRWVASYVVREDDGTFGAYCLYEATSVEKLVEHAEALMLPADSIKPVTATRAAA